VHGSARYNFQAAWTHESGTTQQQYGSDQKNFQAVVLVCLGDTRRWDSDRYSIQAIYLLKKW
jgi:hypothetical protein